LMRQTPFAVEKQEIQQYCLHSSYICFFFAAE
jgi:hypothetical protein